MLNKILPGPSDLFITWLKILTCWNNGVSQKGLVESASLEMEDWQMTILVVPIEELSRGDMDFGY